MTQPESDSSPAVNDVYSRLCPLCTSTGECGHVLVSYDATFPGEDMDGPFVWDDLYPVFEGLYALLNAEIAKGVANDLDTLSAHCEGLSALAPRLRTPLQEMVEAAGWEIDEIEPTTEIPWGPYVVNRVVGDYLTDVFIACGTGGYAGSTRHEDNIPMASSAYRNHWARDAEACSAAAKILVRRDVEQLKALAGAA